MKTHIFYIAITAAAAVILTATTAQAQYAVPPAISMQPSNATYAKKATARFYINASSIDGGYLTYKWYCSGPFSTPFTHPNGTNKDQIINHKTKVSVGTSATLTTTTSTQNGYYYYWVEITNHKDGAVAAIKSSIVEAKVVDRTLFDAIRNGDFEAYTTRDRSDFYNPLYSIRGVTSYNSDYKKYTFETGDPIARGKYAPVTTYPQYLPSKGFWNTTHFYSDRGSEYKGIETMPGVHYMNGKSVPWSRDKSTPPYYSGRTQNESIVAELGAHTPSSIFQEVATVPGKIYEWSLDHGARANSPEVTAVIIGAAINEPNDYTARGIPNRWIKENRLNYNIPSADKQELQTYAYGQNLATFFSDIANKLSKDMKMSNLTAFIGQSGRQDGSTSPLANKVYTTTYGGKQYYLYISSSLTTQDFQHRSGVYTVPAGQGTTIFSFAAITSNAGAGNLLDNIIFRSGSSITSDQKISITNEVQLSASTKPNYAYGIVEIRGSSPIHAGNVKTYYDPDGARGSASEAPISENTSLGLYGWYTGNFTAKGVIIFKNLVPGKTYRIIGIPVAAINPDLHTNESPMYVLDEGYYKNTKIQPTNAGDDKTVWNINLEIYQDDKAKKKVRIGVENARSDVEYALLAGSAAAPNTGAPAHAWTAWKLGAAGNVSFDNLLLDTCYFLIVRPAGYTEMSYADAAYDENKKPAYIKIKTPRQIDIPTIAPSNVARPTGAMISIANTQAHYEYAVIDPETGAIVGAPQSGNNGKLSFVNLDHTKTYRVMVKSKLFNIPWMRVVHVYPYAGPFSIDYYGEAIKSAAGGGNIPDNVEYQIIANDGSNTGIAGGGDVWVSGTGNQPIDLAALILNNGNKSILDSLETLGVSAMLGYRIRPGSDGYAGGSISPIASLAIPKRRTPPASPADYSFDYANEQITTPSIALDFAAIGATTWTSVASGNAWTFTAAGWGVGSMACKFHVRYPATANTFASSSHHTDEIPARPAAPALKIWPVLDSIIISGLKDGTKYEYMRGNGSWSTLKHANGSSPALQFADGDVYYVRLAATANSPASFSVTISLPLGIQSLAFSRYSYQTPPVEQAVNIINIIDAAIDSVTVTLAGANASSFVLTTPENKTIAAHSTNTSWKLKPKDNLDVGTYTAILKMKYKYRALLHEDSAGVHLQVSKSNWNTGMIKGSFDVSATKAERLTLKIANAPQGALLRYYFGLTPVAGNPSDVVPADGKVTRVFTAANGLRPQTTYVLSITAAADKNHNESNRIVLAVGYTACATPVFNNVVRVNYVDEQLELNTGYLPEDYSVICLDATGGAAVAAVAIQEPAYSIAVPVENMSSFKLGLACREKPPYPASDTAYSVAITGRGAAPTGVTTKPQTNMQVSNGKIFLPGVFEYCIRGSSSWNSAKDSVTVQSGNYNVRFPATPTAFASKSTLVRVAGICYVTFNSNGGTFIDQQAVPDGSRATNPSPNPTRLGYNFKGWYTDNNTFANSWNFTTPLDHDTTLHAKWEVISYKITYKNIAGIVSKPTYATYTIASSVALQDVEKAGYKFAGWYVDSLASPTRVTEIARGSTGDVTFWARWKKLYTVTFNVNGGSGAIPSCSIAVGDMAIPPAANPTRTGYAFVSWCTDAATLGKEWNFNANAITQDTTLYAKWQPYIYSVAYDKNVSGATGSAATSIHTYDEEKKLAKNDYIYTGYKFDGWATSPDGAVEYPDTASVKNLTDADGGAVTLYARWTAITYAITYKNVSGVANNPSATTYTIEQSVALQDVEKAGYKFAGWYADSLVSPTRVTEIARGSTGDTTFWARWEKFYTVAFNVNGGDNPIPSLSIADSDAVSKPAPDPQKTGYSFEGWYTDNAIFSSAWNFSANRITQDTTLYAKWTIKTYTVTFVINNDSSFTSQPIAYGNTVKRPEDPAKMDYVFGGWYRDSSTFSSKWDFSSDVIAQNTTLYAKWTPANIRIDSTIVNGVAQKVEDKDTITYVVPCGDTVRHLYISFITTIGDDRNVSANVLHVDVSAPLLRDTVIAFAISNRDTARYTLRVEKRFEFEDVVHVLLGGKLMMVVNNPEHNGGFRFQKAMWMKKVEEYWLSTDNEQFYYTSPAGQPIKDTMRVMLQDANSGAWLETCPYKPDATDAMNRGKDVPIYPNPVHAGQMISIQDGSLVDADEREIYATYRLIDNHGNLLGSGNASDLYVGVVMPNTPGTYYLILRGKAGRKSLKIVVV